MVSKIVLPESSLTSNDTEVAPPDDLPINAFLIVPWYTPESTVRF